MFVGAGGVVVVVAVSKCTKKDTFFIQETFFG